MIIHVTQNDIENGIKGNCEFCPVAIAMTRAFGRLVRVWNDHCLIGYSPVIRIDTPAEVADFISDFDAFGEKGLKPFSFEIK